jgi:hypothetical protein
MPQASAPDQQWSPDLEQQILRAIRAIRYGSVEITIHDSKVVQIERKEKIRIDTDRAEHRR